MDRRLIGQDAAQVSGLRLSSGGVADVVGRVPIAMRAVIGSRQARRGDPQIDGRQPGAAAEQGHGPGDQPGAGHDQAHRQRQANRAVQGHTGRGGQRHRHQGRSPERIGQYAGRDGRRGRQRNQGEPRGGHGAAYRSHG